MLRARFKSPEKQREFFVKVKDKLGSEGASQKAAGLIYSMM